MLHRVRSLVAVLVLGLPAIAQGQAAKAPPPPPTAKKVPAPAASPMGTYTYCDAKMLSVLWKGSVSDAKATIRAKVSASSTAFLNTELTRARTNARTNTAARCNYDEAGLSYSDVETLAKLWKTTASKAKAMIEDKIIAGGEKSLRVMLASSGTGGKPEDPTTTFLKQERYTYCDVKILAEYWKASTNDAKARIGLKLQTKNDTYLNKEVDAARAATKLKCTYVDGGFTFKDVQKLAKLWSISVAESKATIQRKLMSGSSIYLKEEIRAPESPDAAYEAFHAQTKYTYCDAKMIGALWSKSLSEGKVAIGTKLKDKQTAALVKLVATARKNAKKNAEARCEFHEAGLNYDDAVILAKLWKKTESEVKALVPEKIAMGQEAAIQAALKKARPAVKTAPPPPPPTTGPKPPPTTGPKAPPPPATTGPIKPPNKL